MQQTDDSLALSVLRITSTTEVLSYTATMHIKGNKPFDWFFQLDIHVLVRKFVEATGKSTFISVNLPSLKVTS